MRMKNCLILYAAPVNKKNSKFCIFKNNFLSGCKLRRSGIYAFCLTKYTKLYVFVKNTLFDILYDIFNVQNDKNYVPLV